jgi:hypothetical protein
MTDITAFPSHGSMGEVAQDGMTLRDYFAAKAMAYVAGAAELDHVGPAELAAACYEHADAMLLERTIGGLSSQPSRKDPTCPLPPPAPPSTTRRPSRWRP